MTMFLDLDAELAKGVEDIVNPSEKARGTAIPGLDLDNNPAARSDPKVAAKLRRAIQW